MAGDQLSEVFDLVEVRGVLSGGFAALGPWVSRADIGDPLKFVAMVRGRARLRTDGVGPVELDAGDVAILNDRSWLEVAGGHGAGPRREIVPDQQLAGVLDAAHEAHDVVLGGRIELDPAGRALLSEALPPVAHVRAAASAHLRASLHRLFEEAAGQRAGSAFAIRQYGQLLLLDVLRAHVEQSVLPPGWLKLLTDERLRPALTAMHAHPGRTWGLVELAGAAAMSRTSFAERFRAVAGVPPLTYLNRWRMLLAQRALRGGDVRVGELADRLGYGSESAFSTAFKRAVGESPLRYRHRVRSGAAPDGGLRSGG
ncbi:AraC family transcriptional regulator [Actinocatenispora sera]|uniref:AraC family transcriptional regulator n=1 Tax=Actinocatenispora sera TaxID=390989 RepID=UPI0033CEC3DC